MLRLTLLLGLRTLIAIGLLSWYTVAGSLNEDPPVAPLDADCPSVEGLRAHGKGPATLARAFPHIYTEALQSAGNGRTS